MMVKSPDPRVSRQWVWILATFHSVYVSVVLILLHGRIERVPFCLGKFRWLHSLSVKWGWHLAPPTFWFCVKLKWNNTCGKTAIAYKCLRHSLSLLSVKYTLVLFIQSLDRRDWTGPEPSVLFLAQFSLFQTDKNECSEQSGQITEAANCTVKWSESQNQWCHWGLCLIWCTNNQVSAQSSLVSPSI